VKQRGVRLTLGGRCLKEPQDGTGAVGLQGLYGLRGRTEKGAATPEKIGEGERLFVGVIESGECWVTLGPGEGRGARPRKKRKKLSRRVSNARAAKGGRTKRGITMLLSKTGRPGVWGETRCNGEDGAGGERGRF